MKIISWNVNGLRAVEKKGFKEWLLAENADIVCLQETKANEEQLSENIKQINGYYSYFSSAQKKGYSGVGIYSKKPLQSISTCIGIEHFDSEGRVQIAEIATKVLLYNVYFPNGKSSPERLEYKMNFYEAILKDMLNNIQKGKEIICCGDVNTAHTPLDLARPKENEKTSGFLPTERAWIDKLLSCGFVDTLRVFNQEKGQYTWWDYKTGARERNTGWRIDYFFTSSNLKSKLSSAYILAEVKGSDHCPLGITLEI